MKDKMFLPWPRIMLIANKLDEEGLHKLAREARRCVWDEAARLYMLESATKLPSNKFMKESKPILFDILHDVAITLSAHLSKEQILQVMRETVDELERR